MGTPIFCSFDGTVTAVRVRGEGRAVLVEPAPFKDGHARAVFLRGATIEPGLHNPKIEHPAPMEPVAANPRGRPFEVSYAAGSPFVIDIARGAEAGGYQGPLPDGAACPPEWCRVTWGGEAKHIELTRDSSEPFAIAASFPFGVESGESGGPVSSLAEVEVDGARGELRCGDSVEHTVKHIEDTWRWTAGAARALVLRGPDASGARKSVWVEGSKLRVHIENDARPVAGQVPAERAVKVVTLVGVVVIGVAFAMWTLLKRRTAKRVVEKGGAVEKGGVVEKGGASPLRFFVVHASGSPEDERHLDRLETVLKPFVRDRRIEVRSERDVLEGDATKARGTEMRAADVILLLVSDDFLASDACHDEELTAALERSKRGETRVIPIVVRACDVSGQPFAGLQALPRSVAGGAAGESEWKAITSFDNQDEAWAGVARTLRGVIEEVQKGLEKKREAAAVKG